jgi:hypothetical protein
MTVRSLGRDRTTSPRPARTARRSVISSVAFTSIIVFLNLRPACPDTPQSEGPICGLKFPNQPSKFRPYFRGSSFIPGSFDPLGTPVNDQLNRLQSSLSCHTRVPNNDLLFLSKNSTPRHVPIWPVGSRRTQHRDMYVRWSCLPHRNVYLNPESRTSQITLDDGPMCADAAIATGFENGRYCSPFSGILFGRSEPQSDVG